MSETKSDMAFLLLGWAYLLTIAAMFVAAIWTKDVRWLATGIVMVALLAIVNQMAKGDK